MRLPILFLAAFAAAAAQEAPPPDPAPASPPETHTGLSDLNQTVSGLEDAQPDAAPATPAPEEAAPPPAPDEGATTTMAPDAQMPSRDDEPAQPTAEEAAAPTPPEAHPPVLPPYLRHPGAELDPEQTQQIARTVARGEAMVAVARAGAVASQDMLAHIPDPNGAGIAGWIAEAQGNAMMVTFYAADESGPKAVYRVSVLGARAVSRETYLNPPERPALTPLQARLAAARSATDGLDRHPCGGDDFDVLVIPPDGPDAPIDVYQLSRVVERGHFPLGGHFRSRVGGDGHIIETESFGPCRDLVPPATAAGVIPSPLPATGPDDQLPNEIDVYLAAWTGHPLLVASGGRTWRVTPESIAEAQ